MDTPTKHRERSFFNRQIQWGGEEKVETTEEKVKRLTGAATALPEWLKVEGPAREGFLRVLEFIEEKRSQKVSNHEELRTSVRFFVEQYPNRVGKKSKSYHKGMMAAMGLFQSRDEE